MGWSGLELGLLWNAYDKGDEATREAIKSGVLAKEARDNKRTTITDLITPGKGLIGAINDKASGDQSIAAMGLAFDQDIASRSLEDAAKTAKSEEDAAALAEIEKNKKRYSWDSTSIFEPLGGASWLF